MPRIRTIKPEFPQSESIGRLSRDARLLFILLWTAADDYGRLRAAPLLLARQLFPYDEDAPDLMEGWLCELEAEGLVLRYEAEGSRYLEISGWAKHQRVDNAGKSNIPPPPADIRREPPRAAADRGEPPRGGRGARGGSPLDLGPVPRTKDKEDSHTTQPDSSTAARGAAKSPAEANQIVLDALAAEARRDIMAPGSDVGWAGLDAGLRMLIEEGVPIESIAGAIASVKAAGTRPNSWKYLTTAARNFHAEHRRQPASPAPRNRADATSDDAVARRRAALADGARAVVGGDGG